ncbi:flagellar biosynthetic protein FliO [Halothermothrix orenii]|uniref:Flagellar biogenesis protein n=1 Tax=Halothermothrix orenii (strain H 168 / OCM 544 / DSM 9562) TaxID=373903 RepID=B8CYQ4_HALOH|nr:flagellar biosynthetic protein FliO [Halothermothrix orenii]ACL70423.1 flagellar biogenesis protein [Halothermothrix orenii H 168]
MNYGWELARVTIYTLLIIGLIYLGFYLWKRGLGYQKTGRHIHIIERVFLGPKKSLVLLLVKEKLVLVGIDEKGFHVISEWDDQDIDIPDLKQEVNFKGYFQNLISRNRRDQDE